MFCEDTNTGINSIPDVLNGVWNHIVFSKIDKNKMPILTYFIIFY